MLNNINVTVVSGFERNFSQTTEVAAKSEALGTDVVTVVLKFFDGSSNSSSVSQRRVFAGIMSLALLLSLSLPQNGAQFDPITVL